jgi:GTP-dependent phosphoenolpyruvate carboxykinase
VDPSAWAEESRAVGKFFEEFGDRLPEPLRQEHRALDERLQRSAVPVK